MGFDYAAKIRGLLANADSMEAAGNEGAAATYRAKALEWMDRYKIAEEAALAQDPTAAEPIHVTISFQPRDYAMVSFYAGLVTRLAHHTEVRVHLARTSSSGYEMTVVGYEGDVRYFEFLWTSAFLMFTTKIDPSWNPELSEAENIFYLRQAGFKRAQIADMAGWDGFKAADRSKVQRVYVAEARRRGVPVAASGLGFQAKDYRTAYAQGFNDNLARRLRAARDAANAAGGVVELAGRKERVDEAYYMLFPSERPTPSVEVEYVAPNKDCVRCQKVKTVCREHSYLRPRTWTDADERRYQNRYFGASAQAGRATGAQAADGVALRGTHSPTAQRVEASNKALER